MQVQRAYLCVGDSADVVTAVEDTMTSAQSSRATPSIHTVAVAWEAMAQVTPQEPTCMHGMPPLPSTCARCAGTHVRWWWVPWPRG